MAVSGFELFVIASDFVTADMLIWKKYRKPAPGMVEILLDANPQLAMVHRITPFIPVGTYVRVPIDLSLLAGLPTINDVVPVDQIWGARL